MREGVGGRISEAEEIDKNSHSGNETAFEGQRQRKKKMKKE